MKVRAVVHVTIAVPVDGISDHWSTYQAHREAKNMAIQRVTELAARLGEVTTVKVTAVITEGEPEDVKENR